MFDYTSTAREVNAQLKYFGQMVTLKHKSAGGYDPATGSVIVTETEESAIGIVFDYGNKNIDGTLIKAGDKQLYLAPADITTPQVDDLVVVGGVTYMITMVKSLNPAGTVLLYECNLRQ